MSGVIKKLAEMTSSKNQAAPTPREIVEQLDKYIVGQAQAKRSVAIAVRNRWRRQQLNDEMRGEVAPKNILMIGSTGVGKTEIARRLAKLTDAPFIKVEATKYTEVGYYGRDVESMVRELTENAAGLVREQERARVEELANSKTRDSILDKLCPRQPQYEFAPATTTEAAVQTDSDEQDSYERTREKMAAMLDAGELEEREIDIQIENKATRHDG